MPLYRASRAEVLSSLADEFLHNYGRGRAFLAVDGGPLADPVAFAQHVGEVPREGDGARPMRRSSRTRSSARSAARGRPSPRSPTAIP
jgi:hypothetical protein